MGEGERLTRWIVLLALTTATAVVFLVSLRGNYLYGYSLGQTEEKRTLFAWANVGADLWKAFGLIAISMLWRARHRRAAVIGGIAWLMCLAFGINSALGIYVQDRTALTGGQAASHAAYQDAEKQLQALEEQLRGRPRGRSGREIEAAIDALLSAPVVVNERARGSVGGLSHGCTKFDARAEAHCAKVRSLREELAVARETERLDEHAASLRDEIAQLRAQGATIAPDPVGEFYAWLSRGFVSVRDVGFGFPLFFALLIEAVSAFGPLTVAAYADATRRAATGHDAPMRAVTRYDTPWQAAARPDAADDSPMILWMAERAAPTGGNRAIGAADLHADYAGWCAEKGMAAEDLETFERAFDRVRQLPELSGKIRKFGGRYYGIALVGKRRSITSERSRSA